MNPFLRTLVAVLPASIMVAVLASAAEAATPRVRRRQGDRDRGSGHHLRSDRRPGDDLRPAQADGGGQRGDRHLHGERGLGVPLVRSATGHDAGDPRDLSPARPAQGRLPHRDASSWKLSSLQGSRRRRPRGGGDPAPAGECRGSRTRSGADRVGRAERGRSSLAVPRDPRGRRRLPAIFGVREGTATTGSILARMLHDRRGGRLVPSGRTGRIRGAQRAVSRDGLRSGGGRAGLADPARRCRRRPGAPPARHRGHGGHHQGERSHEGGLRRGRSRG